MSLLRNCDVCKMPHMTTKRYGVSRQRRDEIRNHTYGAGGIDLCDPCWSRTCAPKMKAQRAHRRLTGADPRVTVLD